MPFHLDKKTGWSYTKPVKRDADKKEVKADGENENAVPKKQRKADKSD
jgi:hypothetical protein